MKRSQLYMGKIELTIEELLDKAINGEKLT